MKISTRLLLTLSLLASLQASAAGIETSTPAQRAQLMTAFMKDQLKFDAGVLPKVQAINLKYAEMAEPVLKGDDNMFKKRSKMHDIMEAKDKELRSVLSKEQFELYDSKKDDLKGYIEGHL